ncbi:MAG: hypothetical protein M1831_004155 [Alyxoria varia]|nr:MAG: hypothetical protein M1831_004155 [Alyxoria varia]
MSRPLLNLARPLLFSTNPPALVGGTSCNPTFARNSLLGVRRRAFASTWMTTAKEEDPEWLVLIPDHPDPGTLEKRLGVRAQHFDEVRKPFKAGLFNLAGAILGEPIFPPQQSSTTNDVHESVLTTSHIDPTPPPSTAGATSSPFTSSPPRQEPTSGFQNPTDSARGFSTAAANISEKEEPSSPDIRGSVLVARAPSKEAVYEQLRKDVYTTSGVWDLKNTRVVRFLRADVG